MTNEITGVTERLTAGEAALETRLWLPPMKLLAQSDAVDIVPPPHRFEVNGEQLYTWCALAPRRPHRRGYVRMPDAPSTSGAGLGASPSGSAIREH